MPEMISNPHCLIILDNINRLDILQKLYQTIHLTEEVAQEFGKPLANWMMVDVVQDKNYLRILNASVDLGEASTIALNDNEFVSLKSALSTTALFGINNIHKTAEWNAAFVIYASEW